MIVYICLAVAALGLLLLSLLAVRLLQVDKELKLKKYRNKEMAFADLLNYAAVVDDGVVIGKNGAFMAAWIYQGDDSSGSSEIEKEVVSARINQALSGLGGEYMLNIDAVRRPEPVYCDPQDSSFPDPVSWAIDEERRRFFKRRGAVYDGYFVLTLTWLPASLTESKLTELMFDDDTPASSNTARTYALIEQFRAKVRVLENQLSLVLKLTRLSERRMLQENGEPVTYDDFLSWLQYCIGGVAQPILLPKNPMYLDAYLGGQELWGGITPKLGRKYIQVVAIEGFPLESYPGILNNLSELPIEYRWSSRFIFLEQHEAITHLTRFRRKWRQKVRGFMDQVFNTGSGVINYDALAMVEDAELAMAEVNSGSVAMGYYTSNIILMHEDLEWLSATALQVERAIGQLGFVARVETVNTLDAYIGSLPGHGVQNIRRPFINTLNLADMLPTSTIWSGYNYAPSPLYPAKSPPLMYCLTHGYTPFRLNLHIGDVGHTFIFGPTGAGKSTHLGLIAAQLRRYPNMSIFAFDKGMSLYPLTKAVGGSHYSIAADDEKLSFCPLQYLETKGDRAWAAEWIEILLKLNNVYITPEQRNDINIAIDSMYRSGAKTMSAFLLVVQNEPIRQALKQYTIEGSMGHLLDAEQDGLTLSNFVTFEIEELMNMGDKYALPVLLYLFRRIERSLTGQPAAIILDEAWLLLGHSAFRDKIREWLKVLRKANCLVLLATQSLSDAANCGIFDVILESTPTKIFLPNVYARDKDVSELYHRMGLNDRQIEIISQAVPKQEYYYVSGAGRRLYNLALGPLALAFIGASDKYSIAQIKELEASYGEDWVGAWLNIKGIDLNQFLEVDHEA